MRESHDKAFESTEDSGGNIYGALEDLPKVTQSGHYRRMEILANLELDNLENKVAVDFGTGPWSFASIFPQLQIARRCIGFDVSKKALILARKSTPQKTNNKTIYATSDGDFIPLADDSVDIFFGGEVIEHVRNPLLFLQEIARVCKNEGVVILTTPNRDAFNYKIFQQEYCVGPEHIALMNYDEFKKNLETFCQDIKIIGYETSLSSTMDIEVVDAETLNKIQARSENYPELSTGMISISKINKQLYLKNKRELVLNERLWSSTNINYSPHKGQSLNLFDNIEGLLMDNKMTASIPVTGQDISLLFWRHNWSGMVEILCGETTITKDLYSEVGGFIRVDIDNKSLSNKLILKHTGKSNGKSLSNQVIFFKIIEYTQENNYA